MSRSGGEAANEGIGCKMARGLAILAAMALSMVALSGPAWASHAFVTVTNTSDSGEGSLREAISQSNSWPTDTPKRIEFAIPQTDPGYDPTSGVVTISPTSPLPEIHYPVVIDGYSQPGARANTLAVGNDAEIKVVLDGSRAGSAHGLQITEHAGSTVRGLAINRFSGSGIVLRGGGATRNKIEGNFVGTDASGGQDLGNGGNGVTISDSFNNVVGGAQQGAGNVISHNGRAGIKLEGWYSRENRVEANELSSNDGAGIGVGTSDFGGAPPRTTCSSPTPPAPTAGSG